MINSRMKARAALENHLEHVASSQLKVETEEKHQSTNKIFTMLYSYPELLPDLKECACINGSVFDRSQNNRRQLSEQYIVGSIQNDARFTGKKTVNYLSLGSGYLLQDFIICCMLLLQNYSLCVRLIEPRCDHPDFEKDFMKAFNQFCMLEFYARELGLQFTAEFFPTVLDYIQVHFQENIDVVSAIDFDAIVSGFDEESKMDALFAWQKLEKGGWFYLATCMYTWVFNSPFSCEDLGKNAPWMTDLFAGACKDAQDVENILANTITDGRPSIINKYILSYIGFFPGPNDADKVASYEELVSTAKAYTV